MFDAVNLVKTIKRAAVEAQEATKPVQICFGKVIEIRPLKVLVEQKLYLGEAQLVLAQSVTEADVRGGLVAGDEVILLRQQGGQKYIVMDRIG